MEDVAQKILKLRNQLGMHAGAATRFVRCAILPNKKFLLAAQGPDAFMAIERLENALAKIAEEESLHPYDPKVTNSIDNGTRWAAGMPAPPPRLAPAFSKTRLWNGAQPFNHLTP